MEPFAHIAIDGPAGSGKTTVAHALARRLGILYLDTGAMYRAVALLALRTPIDPGDEDAVLSLARDRPLRVVVDAGSPRGFRVFAGGEQFGDELYGNDVSRVVSIVSAYPGVRDLMVERQRAIAAEGPVIMAGRDIGTVVLPTAPVKIFLTASVDERVERRLAELAARGTTVSRPDLRAEIEERDRLDATRLVAPLRPASDAVVIDSSGASVEDVVERVADLVRRMPGNARR
jgi:cytidylate kinase